jgi:hypothetical protein
MDGLPTTARVNGGEEVNLQRLCRDVTRVTPGKPPMDTDGRPKHRPKRIVRRALGLYLVAYFAVVTGAVITLWRSGLINHVDQREADPGRRLSGSGTE